MAKNYRSEITSESTALAARIEKIRSTLQLLNDPHSYSAPTWPAIIAELGDDFTYATDRLNALAAIKTTLAPSF